MPGARARSERPLGARSATGAAREPARCPGTARWPLEEGVLYNNVCGPVRIPSPSPGGPEGLRCWVAGHSESARPGAPASETPDSGAPPGRFGARGSASIPLVDQPPLIAGPIRGTLMHRPGTRHPMCPAPPSETRGGPGSVPSRWHAYRWIACAIQVRRRVSMANLGLGILRAEDGLRGSRVPGRLCRPRRKSRPSGRSRDEFPPAWRLYSRGGRR